MNTQKVTAFVRKSPVLVAGILIALAQSLISIGIWGAGVPMGDEGGHILRALSVDWTSRTSLSAFHDVYALILLLLPDPIVAHLVYRFLLAELSALALWQLLRCAGLSLRSSTAASILWIGCGLGNPLVQFGNVNLFAFTVASLGIALVLRKPSRPRKVLCLVLLGVASTSRVEYLAAIVLFLALEYIQFVRRIDRRRQVLALAFTLIAAVYLFAIADLHFFDQYLLFGFGQCYANYIHRTKPGLILNPFTEYRPLLSSTFGDPHSFLDLILDNPHEFFRYIFSNGSKNAVMVVPALVNPRRLVRLSSIATRSVLTLLLLWTPLLVGLIRGARRVSWKDVPWKNVFYLCLFVPGLAVPIAIHIPDPRYWTGAVPIVYAGVAVAVEGLLRLKVPQWLQIPIVATIAISLLHPMPWSNLNNQGAIRAAQVALAGRDNPTIAASFPEPWVAFARAGKAQARRFDRIADRKGWNLGGLELIVVDDGLRQSKLWTENQSQFSLLTTSEVFQRIYVQDSLALYVSRK